MNDERLPKPSATDSPWFWVSLFCAAGIVILIVAQGQVSQRQARIERQTQGRQRAAEMAASGEAVTEMSTPDNTEITTAPLIGLLVVGLMGSTWMFIRGRHRWEKLREELDRDETPPDDHCDEPAKGHASSTSDAT